MCVCEGKNACIMMGRNEYRFFPLLLKKTFRSNKFNCNMYRMCAPHGTIH